ncbi:hypothetical protein LTR85_011527 [Meristemomyces frigidus]|nr:hypothetical protein LTR85_011527 [Meristemomyces frigidus]
MFRRTSADLPKDPFYPADLSGLGYRLNEHGQIVDAEEPSHFFLIYHTDNDRANEVRKEAIHKCVRKIVLSSLDAMGVKPLYVNDDSFIDTKPEGPHTQILTTELEVLKNKRDVIVVVNEHMQDLGVWAYRLLMRDAGIDVGSAVGLVKKLQIWGSSTAAEDSVACVEPVEKAVEKLKLDGTEAEATTDRKENDTPGLIILNPGQLIYSHQLNESMAQPTWMARPKKTAIDDHIRIDPVHNRVPGHENPDAHVSSVFEHVIRKITREDVRLYVVGLSEGGEAVLKYLDSKFMANTQDPVGDKLEAIALIQPSHTPSQLKSESLANLLAGPRARSWIMDDAPKGTLLNTANSGKPLAHYADSLAASKQSITDGRHEGEGSATSTSGAIAIPPKLDGQAQALNQSSDSLLSSPRSLQAKASLEKSSYSFPQSAAAMLQSVASLQTNGSGSGSASLEQSQSTLSQSHLLDQSKDSLDEPDPYADTPVSCATFSSGELQTAVPELVWPAVMDDVLEWFKSVADDAAAH